MNSRSDGARTPGRARQEQECEVDRALGAEQQPGHVPVRPTAVHQDHAEHQVGEDGRQIEVVARAAGDDDRARQCDEQAPLIQMAAGAEEEVEEHAGSDPDRDVDHGPLGGRGRPDAGCHVALVEDGQHKPERDDRHERVDPGRELEDRRHPGAHPKPIHHGVHRHRGAQGGDRRQGAGEHGRVAPGHLDDVPKEPPAAPRARSRRSRPPRRRPHGGGRPRSRPWWGCGSRCPATFPASRARGSRWA